MRMIYKAWHIYRKKGKAGIQFLRDAHNWFNERLEKNNFDKGPVRLLMDFSQYVIAQETEPVELIHE